MARVEIVQNLPEARPGQIYYIDHNNKKKRHIYFFFAQTCQKMNSYTLYALLIVFATSTFSQTQGKDFFFQVMPKDSSVFDIKIQFHTT